MKPDPTSSTSSSLSVNLITDREFSALEKKWQMLSELFLTACGGATRAGMNGAGKLKSTESTESTEQTGTPTSTPIIRN